MFKGAALFGFVFALIAPQPRAFIVGLVTQTADKVSESAPGSYLVIGLLGTALLVSILMVKMSPKRNGPANPMEKYRRDAPSQD